MPYRLRHRAFVGDAEGCREGDLDMRQSHNNKHSFGYRYDKDNCPGHAWGAWAQNSYTTFKRCQLCGDVFTKREYQAQLNGDVSKCFRDLLAKNKTKRVVINAKEHISLFW
jgi:hypothetical protein